MRALSIKQPWAWAIAAGFKPVENRPWGTAYRGLIAVQASLTVDHGELSAAGQEGRFAARALDLMGGRDNFWDARKTTSPHRPTMALGAVIAVADISHMCRVRGRRSDCDCGPWAMPMQCHWRLRSVQPLDTPVPTQGRLGLWDLAETDPVANAWVLAQLRGRR